MATVDNELLTRRERERLKHEQEILDAAERVFCTRGFHDTSIQDIALDAQFSVGSLYNFFKNKDEIYDHMLQRKARHVVAYFHAQCDGAPNPVEKIRALFRAKASYFAENKSFFRVYFLEMRGAVCNPSRQKHGEVRCAYHEHLDWISQIFREGIAQGMFRAMEPEVLTGSLESLCNAMLLLYLEDEERHEINRNMESIMSVFFEGAQAPQASGGAV